MKEFFKPDPEFIGTKGLVYIGDRVLIYRRGKDAPKYPLYLDVPGGGKERGETPFRTFKREVKEEFDLDISQEDVVYARRYPNTADPSQFGWYAVAKLPESAEHDIRFGDEGIGYTLMSLPEFLKRHDAWPAYQQRALDYLNAQGSST